MNKQEARKRIEKLRKEINHHRYLYHVLDKIEISDAALDSLKHELDKLENQYPDLITPDSPTQRVGGKALAKFRKVEHSKPMMSLYDAFSEEEMEDWETRIQKFAPGKKLNYYVEMKLDGLAVSLIYENGIFVRGATRGDGKIGEDVTQSLKTIEAIPLRLTDYRLPTTAKIIEVRGEVIMTKKVFEELNKRYKKEGKPLLANPRNAAAGSIRQLNPKITAERKLDCYIYGIVTDLGQKTHEDEHKIAEKMGFKTIRFNKYCENLNKVITFYNHWAKNREKLPYDCDGVVVTVNDLSLHKKMGVVGKGPRYMMAYKFAGEEAITIIEDIVVQVGRTGALTPVAHLKPMAVSGVVISRATLHNEAEIERLGLKIGDTVIIKRAGDVIPNIVKVLPKLRTGKEKAFHMPKKCPICESDVERKEIGGKGSASVAYYCSNKDCFAQNRRRLIHFASKSAMDIVGLGPKIIDLLIKEELINNPADLYQLEQGDLVSLERFAEKSAEKLVKAINKSKDVSLARFIFSLGIFHVGEETAELLARNFQFPSIVKQLQRAKRTVRISNFQFIKPSKIADYFNKLSIEDLQKIQDVGPTVAESIYNWFRDKHNLVLLEKLDKAGIKIEIPKLRVSSLKIQGKTFILTGELESLSREQAKEKIRELGGDVSSSVSKNTDFTVVGKNPGSKYDKAITLGVKIIREKDFLKMLE